MNQPHWIDIHCHLGMIKSPTKEILSRCRLVEVNGCINIGTSPEDHSAVLETAQKNLGVACTLGVHPHDAQLYSEEIDFFLNKSCTNPVVVGIGEIGLDYYYNKSTPYEQKRVFYQQMVIAENHQLPVQIHTRDAEEDTLIIMKKFKGKVHGILHCFTGTIHLAEEALALGYDISFSGIITFKKSELIKEVLKIVPLDRLHIETDAPFLAPHPLRGKENEPSFLPHVAKVVAQTKGISEAELMKLTWSNSMKIFSRLDNALQIS